jgi:hypothetical protein
MCIMEMPRDAPGPLCAHCTKIFNPYIALEFDVAFPTQHLYGKSAPVCPLCRLLLHLLPDLEPSHSNLAENELTVFVKYIGLGTWQVQFGGSSRGELRKVTNDRIRSVPLPSHDQATADRLEPGLLR